MTAPTLRALPTQPTLGQTEHEVLTDALADMDGWIERLPVESGWRWTFMACAREIADTVEHLAGREA